MLTHNDPIPLHVYTDHGRFYQVGEHQYPGVGTILNASDSSHQQDFWQQWRANPENLAYSEKAKNRGEMFHAVIEHHFRRDNYRLDSHDADELALAQLSHVLPFWQSVQDVLHRITDIQLIESAVWHEVGCYAGTVDMVVSFDGVPCILDWKTSTKLKKPECCDRYTLQLAAYCGAINRMYDTCISHGVVVVAIPDSEAQVFQFELGDYWVEWLERLVGYWEQQGTSLAAQTLSAIQAEYDI